MQLVTAYVVFFTPIVLTVTDLLQHYQVDDQVGQRKGNIKTHQKVQSVTFRPQAVIIVDELQSR